VRSNISIRAGALVSVSRLLLGAATAASVLVGAMVTRSPIDAAVLVIVCAAVAIALTRPAVLFALGVALLAVEPAKIFRDGSALGRAENFKLVLYACMLPMLLDRGLDRRKCAPLCAYVFVTVSSEVLGTALPGLTVSQTAASLATLSLGWLVFAMNWDWRRDQRLLKVLAWVPIMSVAVAAALQADGILAVFRHTTPPRLEGATIAAWLATLSLCAVMACLVLYRRQQWRWAKWLGLADAAILGATLTRGAVLALGIVMLPTIVRFVRRQLAARGSAGVVKLAVAAVAALAAAAALVPGLQERNEHASVLVGGHGAHEIASGRFEAWTFAYDQAKVNLAFGRGVGAGPLVGRIPGSPAGFIAQHNEYVRMLLEVGILGAVILLLSMFTTIRSVIRRAPVEIRADLTAAGIAFAIYSITENTLSATPLAVAFLLVLGIASSAIGYPSALAARR
jgi:teichuronic acid biosynthesis protein TuaE